MAKRHHPSLVDCADGSIEFAKIERGRNVIENRIHQQPNLVELGLGTHSIVNVDMRAADMGDGAVRAHDGEPDIAFVPLAVRVQDFDIRGLSGLEDLVVEVPLDLHHEFIAEDRIGIAPEHVFEFQAVRFANVLVDEFDGLVVDATCSQTVDVDADRHLFDKALERCLSELHLFASIIQFGNVNQHPTNLCYLAFLVRDREEGHRSDPIAARQAIDELMGLGFARLHDAGISQPHGFGMQWVSECRHWLADHRLGIAVEETRTPGIDHHQIVLQIAQVKGRRNIVEDCAQTCPCFKQFRFRPLLLRDIA